jgi:hypothetical protein
LEDEDVERIAMTPPAIDVVKPALWRTKTWSSSRCQAGTVVSPTVRLVKAAP